MATAFTTNSSNFTQRKNKGFSSQSLRQKHNGEFTGCENMEISPDKIQEYLDSEKMVPASQMVCLDFIFTPKSFPPCWLR